MSADTNFDWQPVVGDGIHRMPPGPAPPIPPLPAAGPAAESPLPLPTAYSLAPPPSVRGVSALQRFNLWVASIVQKFTLPEDGEPVDPLGKLVVATPPWMISMIVHFSMMILLGLAAFGASRVARHEEPPIQMNLGEQKKEDHEIYAERLGEQLEDPSVRMSSEGLEPSKDAVAAFASSDLPEVDSPLIGPVLDPTPNGTLPVGTVPTPAIGLEFSGRDEGVKKALLKAYGGTALTEDAVKEGLAWLARQQKSRGMWSMVGPYKNGAGAENEEAATAMALLAFQGAGHTPKSSGDDAYVKLTARGWTWLLKQQQKDGHFFGNQLPEQHSLYTQALCTIALCELYGMTRDEKYHDPAQKAVDYCVKIQAEEGGWRYQPGIDSDMSVTGWFSMALQSARMAGLEVPSPVYAKISKFLDSVQRDEGARYAYQLQAGATLTLTAEGLLCRQYLGWGHEDQRLRNGVEYILANLPAWDKRNVYYWYYATQVCHHMEGEEWQKWNSVMRQLLPEHQERRGSEKGSWDPMNDRWGDAGGRLYVTCLSLYTLEVYYRHLPIYRHELLNQ
jgi:Prenyltransferase and squalene oxidase repeat